MGGDQFDEADDSFFELELTVPDFDDNFQSSSSSTTTTDNKNNHPLGKGGKSFDYELLALHDNIGYKADNTQLKCQQPTLSMSPTRHNFLSKRKVLPIEPVSKPQSPLSYLLKSSAPRFQILMFMKSKSMAAAQRTGETELNTGVFEDTQKEKKQESSSTSSSKFFTKKFMLQEGSSVSPLFTRKNSLRKQIADDSLSGYDHSSKRFSMELIHKYLKLFNPLYIKRAKQTQKSNFSGETSAAASFPNKGKLGNIPAGIRVECKHLEKSKSASASASTGVSPSSRRHDSLLLQLQHDNDGIQSAILHCKKSFNSSTDSSLLSRFTSDPLVEQKSMASPRISNQCNGIK